MSIEQIEDKLDYIVTEIISPNYNIDDFVDFLLEKTETKKLGEYLEKHNLADLSKIINEFIESTPSPEPWDGAARFTEDILKTVDIEKYPCFSQHPYLIKEEIKAKEVAKEIKDNWEKIDTEVQSETTPVEENSGGEEEQSSEVNEKEKVDSPKLSQHSSVDKNIDVLSDPNKTLSLDFEKEVQEEQNQNDIETPNQETNVTVEVQDTKQEKSESSVDNIELTVSSIQTENLQVMKEKPTVNLIK